MYVRYELHCSPIKLVGFQLLTCFTSKVENRVDPDRLDSEKPAYLDLCCFLTRTYLGSAGQGVEYFKAVHLRIIRNHNMDYYRFVPVAL